MGLIDLRFCPATARPCRAGAPSAEPGTERASGAAQRRRLDARTVRVTRQLYYHEKGFKFGPPKSKAGVRTVPFPELIVPDLQDHLEWVPFPVSLVFCSSTGTPLSHSNFRRRVWLPALATVGLEGVHVHDLRHTGNQLTANAGANPKELMARMCHDSERAALIYRHSSAERQRTLADEVGRMAAAELAKSKTAKPSGTLTAREPNGPDGPADGKSPDLRK